MKNISVREKEGQEFRKRRNALDLKRGEFAVLFDGRTIRCLDFYMTGQRRIPPEVWVRLEDIENMPRPALMRLIVNVRDKQKKGLRK